jgi:hypothetical protein
LLEGDSDRDWILHGIRHGFDIIDNDKVDCVRLAESENNKSCLNPHVRNIVEKKILSEVAEGNYVIVEDKPILVSPLSAVPKSNGDIRVVHDLSQPDGLSLNDFATKQPFTYQTIEEAIEFLEPGWYMAKVDLQAAYRSVAINPAHSVFTGLKWTFEGQAYPTYMIDTKLPFGARYSPYVFNRITQAVRRNFQLLGYQAVVTYLDDFWVAAETQEQCCEALNSLIKLLRGLGFRINYSKVDGPSRQLTFLGVQIDTVRGFLRLDPRKRESLVDSLHEFKKRYRASRKQLERLAGRLSWAACVVPWGRLHIRSLFDILATLKRPHHKCRITIDIKQDLLWWIAFLSHADHGRLLWDSRPEIDVCTDASSLAGGAFCRGDWLYSDWNCDRPNLSQAHINIKELGIVCEAAWRWRESWSNHKINIYSDNKATVSFINNGTSPCGEAVCLIRELSYLALKHRFSLRAYYIAGCSNILADAISRLYMPNQIARFMAAMRVWYGYLPPPEGYWLPHHMSMRAISNLSFQIRQWKTSLCSWKRK